MAEGTAIRPATRADRRALVLLLAAQFREHRIGLARAAIARAVDAVLARPGRGAFVIARRGRRALGLAALSFVWPLEHGGRSAWLEELYVVPRARGRGLGTALLRAACRVAAARGAAAVDLEVQAGHQRAARLYAREGFQRLPRTRFARRLAPRAGSR